MKNIPSPAAAAKAEANRIGTDHEAFWDATLGRVLRDAPWLDRDAVIVGVTAYHKDALGRIPSAVTYPEAVPWVEYMLTYERELRRATGLDDAGIAVTMSLNPYLSFRGSRELAVRTGPDKVEKCRSAFLPQTDRGPMFIKNIDDPPNYWRPDPPLPARAPGREWSWERHSCRTDGVGSGLHIDDEPDEIFPLPVFDMWRHHANDVPGILQFLERYAPFWGGRNLLLYDGQLRSAAIEKCSHNFFEVFPFDAATGFSHISGMACRDPGSPQGAYQRAKREQYRERFALPDDGPDKTFWQFCDRGERMLAEGLRALGPRPRAKDIMELFTTPYPDGLCKGGYRYHARQPQMEYTLITVATLFEERRTFRWQRSLDCRTWPDEPEICLYDG